MGRLVADSGHQFRFHRGADGCGAAGDVNPHGAVAAASGDPVDRRRPCTLVGCSQQERRPPFGSARRDRECVRVVVTARQADPAAGRHTTRTPRFIVMSR
jgi:hypothetical protein